jgi:hypothetical protein
MNFLLIYSSFGDDRCKELSPSIKPDGGADIRLYAFTDKSFDSFAEMLIIDAKGRKTGNDTIRSYAEIPESGYAPDEGVEGNKFYYAFLLSLTEGETLQIKIIGKRKGLYTLGVYVTRNKGDLKFRTKEFVDVPIKKGETHNYTLKFSLTVPMEIKRVN